MLYTFVGDLGESMIPNFFIVGAPKCGTTSVANWLSQNPNVFMPEQKEPSFFNSDGLGRRKTIAQYERLFSNAARDCRAIGEASTHYLESADALENIKSYLPSAKIVICLRNPIDMAISLHAQRIKDGAETILDFWDAWNAQERRRNGEMIPYRCRKAPQRLQYGDFCKLGEQAAKAYRIFDSAQILPILFEDIRSYPERVYKRLCNFLGVSDSPVSYSHLNQASGQRSYHLNRLLRLIIHIKREHVTTRGLGLGSFLARINKIENVSIHDAVCASSKKKLLDYFWDDIVLLEEVTGYDLKDWRIGEV